MTVRIPTVLAAVLAAVAGVAQETVLHVAPGAAAGGDGTPRAPFTRLQEARDHLRRLRREGGLPRGGVAVELAAGLYAMAAPLEFSEEDSGSAESPVLWRAAPGAEVRLSGGVELTDWRLPDEQTVRDRLDPAARHKVLVADLKAMGITQVGFPGGGFGYSGPEPEFAELFFNDRPMTMSRWPNEGFLKVGELKGGKPRDVRGTKGDNLGVFVCPYDRLERWVGEPELWLHGWWFWDWADQRQQVAAIDLEKRVVTLADPQHAYGYRKGMWYYAFNAIAEIDRPGEYCLDRDRGLLTFWPPDPIDAGRAVLLQSQGLVRLHRTSFVSFHRLIFENSRATAAGVREGRDVVFQGCTFRNGGGWAVSMSGTINGRVVGCDIHEMGQGGISLSGGDRRTLTGIGLEASNNHIHHYARWNRILKPGISITGVGIRVAHNLIHDAPHIAILFSGNDHRIEYNEIHSVCHESNDAGAIYAGRDWTMRGHVIRHNYLHHISGFEGRGCVGIYLDDMFSSVRIEGNLFCDVTRAAFIGGGRDNAIVNNLFVDCRPALHIDARALGWAAPAVQPGAVMHRNLDAVPYREEPWRSKYPELVGILEDEPAHPKGNLVSGNICWGGRWDEVDKAARERTVFRDNQVHSGRQFLGETFQLRPDHPALAGGFAAIPTARIGLLDDETRASWPVLHEIRPRGRPGEKIEAVAALAAATRPCLRALLQVRAPRVDGVLEPDEWGGLDPSRAVIVARGLENDAVEPRSTAWVMTDGTHLFVALDNAVDPTVPLKREARWGANDAVELAFRVPTARGDGPILVLRGYPCGAFESSQEAGASAEQAARAATGVAFAAGEPGPGRWVAEWSIPLSSLGVEASGVRRLPFNLSVRKTAQALWVLWQGTHHATWQVDQAGWLELPSP
ncbi:MAG: right-handed parallel beta-helix repeat-containing protein [Lentisphaeria bacterium]|nr:right-handed parallel beta-helix repeat-containing protein [Lentisphaeria bacterium]